MRGATLAGCGAIGLWAVLALLSRAASGVPPLQLTAMSFAVSGGLGLAWLAASGRLQDLRQPPLAWLHGVGGLFGFHALYFASLARAPAATANLINYTWPLLIVLLSAALLGMRLTRRHGLGTALALAGCAMLLGGGAAFPAGAALGYALAAASAVVWALYSVLSRRFPGVPAGAMAGFCAGTAVLAGAAHLMSEATVALDASAWAAVLALGLGPVGAAFVLWDRGMKHGDPRLLGTLAFATPVLSTLILATAGLAPFTVTTVAAAALVAAGGFVAAAPGRAAA
ncbi:MAG: aromatic amino acid exporter YddG [Janthinobacterium lividum]